MSQRSKSVKKPQNYKVSFWHYLSGSAIATTGALAVALNINPININKQTTNTNHENARYKKN